jgi:hypothetical protein
MNAYLDMAGLRDVLDRYYSAPDLYGTRLMGRKRESVSAYYSLVRFFGPEGIAPDTITIDYLSEPFRFADPLIAEFSAQIERELRNQGRLYYGPNVLRLVRFARSSSPRMIVQEARYGDQCAGFALDYRSPLFAPTGGTLRGYIQASYPDRHTGEHPLAGCLGVCGLLLVGSRTERKALIVHRSARLASLESTVGPSVAGSVESEPRCGTVRALIERALGAELREELGLAPNEYRIHPLAYGREVLRGDRPQLFCLVTTELEADEIGARLERMPIDDREFDWFRFVDWGGAAPETLNFEAAANWYLACEYPA